MFRNVLFHSRGTNVKRQKSWFCSCLLLEKRQCKRDGGSTNNLVDRISELPEALILHILSLLPTTKVAITTSVLSKQWQSHWKMLPKLTFDSFHHGLELGNVCKSLISHKAPVLQSFHLRVYLNEKNNAVDTGILIGIALTRNVRELVLEVHFLTGSFTFPASLYNCDKLQTLKLSMRYVIMDVPSTVCLKSLRTLHLHYLDFKDDESFLNLLSGCPSLENLDVCTISSRNVKIFTISVSSLQRLSIHNGYGKQPHSGYVINAPSLKYLKIEGFKALDEPCLIENVPELVEASIINVSEIICEKLLGSLTSVKRLSLTLSSLKIKFPTGCIFNQLVYLELYTDKEAWWNLLILMLGSSPKLQVLKLINKSWLIDLVASGKWKQPKNVPECLLLHLETFIWKGYEWEQKEETKVAKYILKNSNHLKGATFFSEYDISSEDRLAVVKELKSVVKDTNSCQFQFK